MFGDKDQNVVTGIFQEPPQTQTILDIGNLLTKSLQIYRLFWFFCQFQNCVALKKGSGGWKKVAAVFGEEILLDNGEVK